MEGSLTTYRFNNAHYVQHSRYAINNGVDFLEIQGSAGIKMPAFLDRAKPACQSVETEPNTGAATEGPPLQLFPRSEGVAKGE